MFSAFNTVCLVLTVSDDSVDSNENIIRVFSQYPLAYTKEYVLNLAKGFGAPADIPVTGRYNVNLFMRGGAGREWVFLALWS